MASNRQMVADGALRGLKMGYMTWDGEVLWESRRRQRAALSLPKPNEVKLSGESRLTYHGGSGRGCRRKRRAAIGPRPGRQTLRANLAGEPAGLSCKYLRGTSAMCVSAPSAPQPVANGRRPRRPQSPPTVVSL